MKTRYAAAARDARKSNKNSIDMIFRFVENLIAFSPPHQ